MTAPTARPRYLVDHSVMSHYWLDPTVRAKIDQLASVGTLCSSMVTMDEARFSARSMEDLAFVTDLYSKAFFWLPFDEDAEGKVADIRAALWKIGAGRGAQTTDVLIAATAIRHDAVIVHNDTDFLTLHRAVPELNQLRIVPSTHSDAGS
ncbi:type II toxin-antitoxin system VapC family toxin [uncultured Mycobacterium sp.]|uniref:type II toxin-antitoxin system VapC family toxin n=1 Tax=uncultured Mycobacterium sp. TaxID=171292 RepID=UPI0035C9F538